MIEATSLKQVTRDLRFDLSFAGFGFCLVLRVSGMSEFNHSAVELGVYFSGVA